MHSATVNSEEEGEREEKKQNLAKIVAVSQGKHVGIRVHAIASVRAAICVAY